MKYPHNNKDCLLQHFALFTKGGAKPTQKLFIEITDLGQALKLMK